MNTIRPVFCILILFFSTGVFAQVSIFDTPLKTQQLSLGPSPAGPGHETMLTCEYFKDFMVKEVDLGEKGSEQLSILLTTPANKFPLCQRKNVDHELILKDWGYFKGVKAHYVFLSGSDGVNGGVGFAVFDGHNGKQLFEDLMYGNFDAIAVKNSAMTLRYTRAYTATCSVVTEGEACWDKIKKEIGLVNVPMPDCLTSYRKSQKDLAHGRCKYAQEKDPLCFQKAMKTIKDQRWDEASSMIGYHVSVSLQNSKTIINPMDEKIICWPSD